MIRLLGGRTTPGVVQVGETVRRPLSAQAPFVHALLSHLERRGFSGAPRFLGIDGEGRESLSFIPGVVPSELGVFSDVQVHAAARLLRQLHDATEDCSLKGEHEVVCHGDASPCNCVFVDGMPAAFIDLDTAHPGSRADDVGYASWLWLDVGNDELSAEFQGRRISAFFRSYGMDSAGALDAIIGAQRSLSERTTMSGVREWSDACRVWVERNREAIMAGIGGPYDQRLVRAQRAQRSLRGLSIGDALGHALATPGQSHAAFDSPPWRFTDDTEMAIAIVDQLKTRGAIDQDSLAHAFAGRFARQPERGYGAVAYWILSRIEQGMPWREAASTPYGGTGSKGNGAAMRVAPLGAYFADDPTAAVSEAIRSAAVTHAHEQGQAGVVAVALAASHLVRDPDAGLATLQEIADGLTDHELSAALERAMTFTDAKSAGRELGVGEHVLALDTVPFVLWAAFSQPRDFRGAILLAISGLTGPDADKDTVCGMVGSLVALSADPRTIPQDWSDSAEPLPSHDEA